MRGKINVGVTFADRLMEITVATRHTCATDRLEWRRLLVLYKLKMDALRTPDSLWVIYQRVIKEAEPGDMN